MRCALLTSLAVLCSRTPAQDLDWARRDGGPSLDKATSVATLPDGACVVVGRLDGPATFGLGEANETTLQVGRVLGLFVARYQADGQLAWAKTVAHDSEIHPIDNATFADGSSLVVGRFRGRVTFGPSEAAATELVGSGFNSLFLARYHADGRLDWARREIATDLIGHGVATFADGSIGVVGQYKGSPTFGQGETHQTTLASDNDWDVFVARYGGDGRLLWARRAGSAGQPHLGRTIAALPDGSAVVAGWFHGPASFGSFLLQSGGQWDLFLARYDGQGDVTWVRRAPGASAGFGALAAFADGSVVMADKFSGSLTLGLGEPGQTTLASNGSTDLFVARFAPDGRLVWARRMGGEGADEGLGVAALADGSCAAVGLFSGQAVFGPADPLQSGLTAQGSTDAFVLRLSATGQLAALRQWGGAAADEARAVGAFTDGSLVAAGSFQGSARLDDLTLVAPQGSIDALLARYAPPPSPPRLVLPTAVTAECDSPGMAAAVAFDVEVTGRLVEGSLLEVRDVTGQRLLLAQAAVTGPVSVGSHDFPIGQSTIEAKLLLGGIVLDAGSFTVAVADTTPPVLSGCEPKTIEAQGLQTQLTKSLLGVAASDDCDPSPSLTLAPELAGLGVTQVTATARDASGNESRASFALLVADTTPPVFEVAAADVEKTAATPHGAVVAFDVAATDACGPVVIDCHDQAGRAVAPIGTLFAIGEHVVTCRARDPSGNSAEHAFRVTIHDNLAPVMRLPDDIVAPTEPGQCFARVFFTVEVVDDDTLVSVVTTAGGGEVRSGDAFPVGTTVVLCTATDSFGNVVSGSFRIVVVDREPPVLTGPATKTLITTCEGDPLAVLPGDLDVAARDNCDPSPRIQCEPAQLLPGSTRVLVVAHDLDGNRAAVTVDVTVLRGPFEVRRHRPAAGRCDQPIQVGRRVPIELAVLCGGRPARDLAFGVDAVLRLDAQGRVVGQEPVGAGDLRVHERRGAPHRVVRGRPTHHLELDTRRWTEARRQHYRVVLRITKPGHADTVFEVLLGRAR